MSLWLSNDAKGTLIEAPYLPKPHAGYPDFPELAGEARKFMCVIELHDTIAP
jgi:hypothetical protein